mgnify:CR=1 FL=1
MKKQYELVEQGIYTPEEFTKRTKVIKDKINSTTKELSKYQVKVSRYSRNPFMTSASTSDKLEPIFVQCAF